ncbi:MAG: LuxR C-terminal-related transcriptional regulator [Solirubrobacteraceae bacterium]
MSLVIDHEGGARRASVVGRDLELGVLDGVLSGGTGGDAILMIGGAGIGKTTLWDAGVAAARARGVLVLAARSSGSEAQLPFAGLIDLCDRVGPDELSELAPPQRLALEVALLRAQPGREAVRDAAIALGLLGVVRSAAARHPVLIAVDDLQWLDQPSADLLAFVVRRIGDADVRFLLARRPARRGALEQVLVKRGLRRVSVGGLSLGAMRRLLFERLELTLSRQLLSRIVEVTQGNPLFALEIGRSLFHAGTPTVADEIPLPDAVGELFGERVARLPSATRRVLLAVALSADPCVDRVAAVTGAGAIEDAVEAEVVEIEGDRLRAAHPLLAAAAARHSRARERRELHLALAAVAGEEQLRILHLALATLRSDTELAARVAAAAEDACARGARAQAVLLARHALRLTPAGALERPDRVLMLAEHQHEVGDLHRLTALLEGEMASLPKGPLRAHALLLLSGGASVSSLEDENRYLEQAVEECGNDRNMRADVLARMADNLAAGAISHLSKAESWALEAVGDATEPRVQRYALHALAWTRTLTGRPVDDLCERSRVIQNPAAHVSSAPERVAAQRLTWRGELQRARALLNALSALADRRGELVSYSLLRLHLCELELRTGDLDAASLLLEEWAESSDHDLQFRPQYHRCRALLAAERGDAAQAKRWATEAIERARATGCRWDELEARRARAMARLVEQRPEEAVEDLRSVWEHCEREGLLEPGVFPVAPELVEALVELHDVETAKAVTERLGQLAEQQEHPWARAAEKRCHAIATLASGQHDVIAAAFLREAADDFERLGLRFDAARCQLALGRALRRAKRWRDARETLEAAAAAFAALKSTGWEDRARAELSRVGARRPRSDGAELTPSECRVVELAAEGLANKQIASTLYVSVNTVEVHLVHAYAKLGVHSRAQLARALMTGS